MAMSLRNLMGAGLGAGSAGLINGTVADNLTATGSTQADALLLPNDVNVLTTVPVATGVRLPALPQPGDENAVANLGANALAVYPPPGATIEGGPANAPFSLPAGAAAEFVARLGSSNWIAVASAGAIVGTPIATGAASFVDGAGNTVTAPIVRQVLFINPGPFTPAATSYSYQVYSGGVAIPGESGTFAASGDPFYVVTDDQAGNTLSVKCYGITAAGQSPTTSDSASTTAVAAMSAASGITLIARTSASGATPPVIQHTFDLTKVLPLDVVRVRESTDGTFSGADIVQNVVHFLTSTDLAGGAVVLDFVGDGFATPGAVSFLDYALEMTSPHGAFLSFTYPTTFSPTDAVSPMVYSTTDKDAGVALSGGNLTAAWGGGGSNYAGVRTNRGLSSGKLYWETAATGAGVRTRIAVASGSASISTTWSPSQDGGSATDQAACRFLGNIEYNTTAIGASPTIADGDAVDTALDVGAKKVWWRVNNGSWLPTGDPATGTGGQSISAMSTPIFPASQFSFGGSLTTNFGTTPGGTAGFVRTPPTGFVAP